MADIKVDDSASPSRRGSFDTRSIKSQTSKKKATDEQGVYDGPTLDAGASSSNKSHAAADADEALEYEREELALKTRFGALALLLFLAAGANWGDSALGPLKSTIVKELKIDNTQYGIIASAVQLTNTIIPIFSGLWIDRYGAAHMAVVATLAVFVGSIVTASGAQSDSYATVVAGRVIQGLGYLTADTTTAKLIITWFRGGGWLAFAVSFNFAFERAISVASKASAVPISQSTGDYAWTLWVGSIICGVSFVFSLAYVGYERWAMPAHMRSLQEFKKHQTKDARVQTFDAPYNRRNILKAASTLPAFFVFLTATQFYQPIAVFNNLSADIIRRKGKTVEVSGYLSSVNQIVPIVVTPMLGAFFDRFGHRME